MSPQKLQSAGSHLILYDGLCGLCNRFNLFVLAHDKQGQFKFASLQSSTGKSLLRQFRRNPDVLDTFYVVPNYELGSRTSIERGRAGLFVLKALGSPWSWAGIFGILPDALLNIAYDCLARIRYRIFGKYDQCKLPSDEHRERFIDV